jgi:hypothetical protein
VMNRTRDRSTLPTPHTRVERDPKPREPEGTPRPARAATRGHSLSGDSFFVRGLRARGFPGLPRSRLVARRERPAPMMDAGIGDPLKMSVNRAD